MPYSRGSHTAFHHRYHIVWAPKYRFKVLHGEVRLRVREIIRQGVQRTGREDHPWRSVARSCAYVCRDTAPHCGQRLRAPGERPLIAQDTAGVRAYPQTLLGPAFLAARLFLHHIRQHNRSGHLELSGQAYQAKQNWLQPQAMNLPASAGLWFSGICWRSIIAATSQRRK